VVTMSEQSPIRIATRASALALAQTSLVAEELARLSQRRVDIVPVSTRGDRSAAPLDSFGSVGVFVSAVRAAVIEGRADVAVHSLKDVPTAPEPRVLMAAIPQREDPRDALCSVGHRTLAQLAPGAVVGTGSPRRAAFLRASRPDLQVRGIRGNVDTRLALLDSGNVDAVVLACAGLSRLGRMASCSQALAPDIVLPAAGQGALAVECRSDSSDTSLLAALDDLDSAETRAAVVAERSLLATLEAGCTAPVGALAVSETDGIQLQAAVVASDGSQVLRLSESGSRDDAAVLGETLAARLIGAGAARLMGMEVR